MGEFFGVSADGRRQAAHLTQGERPMTQLTTGGRAHHELGTANPQAIALLLTGAGIYGGRLITWIAGKVRKS